MNFNDIHVSSDMKIAITGSWKPDEQREWDLRQKNNFVDACVELGNVIGETPQSEVIVNSDKPHVADKYVLQGIIDIVRKNNLGPYPITVIYPKKKGNRPPFETMDPEQRKFLKFTYSPVDSEYVTVAHFISTEQADVVVSIGGGFTTYLSGSYAILSRKKVVPIGSFGGASRKVLDKILQNIGSDYSKRTDLTNLSREWSKEVLASVSKLIREFPLVWIVHGHAERDRNDLVNFLKTKLNLSAVVMGSEHASGPTPTEKFEDLASRVQCAIILATPDDEGRKKGDANQPRDRARQNVWLELGWFWAALGRNRVLFMKKQGDMEIPSDYGVVYESYENSPSDQAAVITEFISKVRSQ